MRKKRRDLFVKNGDDRGRLFFMNKKYFYIEFFVDK